MHKKTEQGFFTPVRLLKLGVSAFSEIVDYLTALFNITGIWAIFAFGLNIITFLLLFALNVAEYGFSFSSIISNWKQGIVVLIEHLPFGIGEIFPGTILYTLFKPKSKKQTTPQISLSGKKEKGGGKVEDRDEKKIIRREKDEKSEEKETGERKQQERIRERFPISRDRIEQDKLISRDKTEQSKKEADQKIPPGQEDKSKTPPEIEKSPKEGELSQFDQDLERHQAAGRIRHPAFRRVLNVLRKNIPGAEN